MGKKERKKERKKEIKETTKNRQTIKKNKFFQKKKV